MKTLSVPGFEWHEPTAWSPIGVPTASDSVIIGGATFIQPDSLARARHVTITAGGELIIERDLGLNKPGKLLINSAPGNAIYNEGKLINGGRITINTAGGAGVWNKGDFQLLNKARLNIDSVITYAIRLENAAMSCDGAVTIERSTVAGIYATHSTFHIGLEGNVSLKNCHNYGIHNSSLFENRGIVKIDTVDGNGHGIYNSGHFENYDTLMVSNTYNGLLENYDSLTNHMGAVILLNNSESSYGLYSDGYCANHGSIYVDHTDDVAVYAHTEFYNNGKIGCSYSDVEGVYLEEGIFVNNGHLEVSHSHTGLYVESTSHFVNIDSFVLDSIDVFGIYNTDSITNDGYLSITNCREPGAMGIYNADYTTVILNTGKIELYNIDSIALLNLSDFINEDTLLIERIYDIGLYNEDSIYNGVNGYIDIRSINAEKAAIVNLDGTFYNQNIVKVDNCEGMGMVNLGSVINEDSISISNLISFGILNFKDFENHAFLSILNVRENNVAESISSNGGAFNWTAGPIGLTKERSATKSSSGFSDNVAFENNGSLGTASLINHGQMFLRDADIGLLNSGLITNVDSIDVDEVRLGISSCYPMAMTMDPIAVVIDNDGYIHMETEDGMIVGGGTTFNISSSGELVIRSSDDDMININLEAIFDCSGILDIDQVSIEP